MIDLNHTRTLRSAFSEAYAAKIDAALEQRGERQGRRIGASAVGDECARRVQLGVWASHHPDAPPIKAAPWSGKLQRTFERGHDAELRAAQWMREAGVQLSTLTEDGDQHGWEACDNQICGYVDGIIAADDVSGAPAHLWECKAVNSKTWRSISRDGILRAAPKYDAQAQINMAYMQMPTTLFTVVNADTCELYFEYLTFDSARAQAASDRAVKILQATKNGELLPRAASTAEAFPCSFCRFREECWP